MGYACSVEDRRRGPVPTGGFFACGWQLLETRKPTSENTEPEGLEPEYQYVWSARYIDAGALRDKNTGTDRRCTPIHRGGLQSRALYSERLRALGGVESCVP